MECGIVLREPPPWACSCVTFSRCRSSLFKAVFDTSPEHPFCDFWTPKPPKMEPEWTPKSQKTGADGLPDKRTRSYAHVVHFVTFLEKVHVPETLTIQNYVFLRTVPRPTSSAKHKNTFRKPSHNLPKWCPEASRNRLRKKILARNGNISKMCDMRVPKS